MRADVERLATALFDHGCVEFGTFTLKSGLTSPIYIDLRLLVSHPRLLRRVAGTLGSAASGLAFDRIAAIPYAALPIGVAMALEMDRALIYPRREVKGHGTRRAIEGTFEAGETALLVDDLITRGGSKLEAIEALEAVLRPLAVELEIKTGELFGALRVAVTGRTAAPPLFQTMAVLGRERCLRRIRAALDKLAGLSS